MYHYYIVNGTYTHFALSYYVFVCLPCATIQVLPIAVEPIQNMRNHCIVLAAVAAAAAAATVAAVVLAEKNTFFFCFCLLVVVVLLSFLLSLLLFLSPFASSETIERFVNHCYYHNERHNIFVHARLHFIFSFFTFHRFHTMHRCVLHKTVWHTKSQCGSPYLILIHTNTHT